MNPKAILFDLDGTLVDTIGLYEKAFLEVLWKRGHDISLQTFREWYMEGIHLKDIAKMLRMQEEMIPVIRKERDDAYKGLLASETKWLPWAQEALKEAKKIAPIAVITGSWMTYLQAMRPCTDIFAYTDVIVTADDFHEHMKPEPHGLLIAAGRLKVDPKECVYIGDQSFDVEAARRADMKSILLRGTYTPEHTAKPDAETASIREVVDLMKSL